MIRLIAAIDRQRGIAKHGVMPWNIPDDEKFFTDQTKSLGGHVLSGGATFREAYQSKPLPDRHNYIYTRQDTPIKGVELVHDLQKFLDEFQPEDLWVAGGAEVFSEVIKLGKADILYLTFIDADFGCDKFFPEYKTDFHLVEEGEAKEQNGFHYKYTRWELAT